MFLKRMVLVTALIAVAYGEINTPESKKYLLENLNKQLDQLVQKKKSARTELQLDILFDEYVDDAKKLLENLDYPNIADQQCIEKEDTIKQIAHYMAVLQKLLAIMNNNEPKPLESFCTYQRSDILWGAICGDRPTKRILRPEGILKKDESENNVSHMKFRYADSSDEIPTIPGQ